MGREVTAEYVVLVLLTGVAGLLALATVVILYLRYAGPRRAALAPAAAVLSLAAPLCAIGGASKYLVSEFSKAAIVMSGMEEKWPAACGYAKDLSGLGVLMGIGTLLLAAALGFWPPRRGPFADRFPASAPRMLLLLALPIVPWILGAAVHEYVRGANRMAVQVMEAPPKAAEDEAGFDRVPDSGASGAGSIAALSSRIGRGLTVGMLAPTVLLLVIAGFAAAAAILAWRVDVGPAFQLVSALMLAGLALLCAAGMFFFERRVALPF
jgi:hypothetical protein